MMLLRPSGDESFEELIARLLSGVCGERIRRCKAGTQQGVDALAEIPFGIEVKRHREDVGSRDLLGGLADAAISHPTLQLWVLVATTAVKAQNRKSLTDHGLQLGIAVFILDSTACEPDLPGVRSLDALAATDIEATIDVLANPAWRTGGSKPNLNAVRTELKAIQRKRGLKVWKERLRKELRDLPTWRHLVRRQNARLRALIDGDAANAFGTPYDPEQAIPRSAEAELAAWWRSCVASGPCDIAVVTGDRYDGKTWLVYRWLSENLRRLPLPAFFFSSKQVQSANGDLEALILQEARRSLDTFERHAQAILIRQKSQAAVTGPWCMVILDGANEYITNPDARADALLWAVPPKLLEFKEESIPRGDLGRAELLAEDRASSDKRGCAVLVTCRARDFEDDASWLGSRRIHHIPLGAYDDQEFPEALKRQSLAREQLECLSPSALLMIRRPRYLGLVIRHQKELGDFPGVTPDVLQYLDASDKVGSRGSPGAAWNADALKQFLVKLAKTWTRDRKLELSTVLDHVRAVTEKVDEALASLKSEGVITLRPDGMLVPDLERLALGMGLFIRDALLNTPHGTDLPSALADILEPHRDDDEKVRWLRAAVTTSVLAGDTSNHPNVVETLLWNWLSARNFSHQDLHDLRSLASVLTQAFLRLVSSPHRRTKDILLLAEPIIDAGISQHEAAVGEAVRQWFRIIPTGSRWYIGGSARSTEEVARAASQASLGDLHLTFGKSDADESVRSLQQLGLSLAYRWPVLVGPKDVLALLAVRDAVGGYLADGEGFAVRRILSGSNRTWYEEEVRDWEGQPEAPRVKLLRRLLGYADREDLVDLIKRLPEPERPRWPTAISREELATLVEEGIKDEKTMLDVGARARFVALEPTLPPPPSPWRAALGRAATNRFDASVRLHAFRCATSDDHDLEEVEPALAAWAPEAGAEIWRTFLGDIPRRVAEGEESWSWEIEGHAALLTSVDRGTLLKVVRGASSKASQLGHALECAYSCVLAGSSESERLRLLLAHPFREEWAGFYDVLSFSGTEAFRHRTHDAVRSETDSKRLKRARYLSGRLGGAELSTTELPVLIHELSQRGPGEDAARFLLTRSRIPTATTVDALGPLVQVARSLSEIAWQYEAFASRKRDANARGCLWVAWALSAPVTARSEGADDGVPDDVAVSQGIERLGSRVAEELRGLEKGRTPVHEHEQFPDGVVRELDEAIFNEWVSLLLAVPARARHLCIGLLVPVVRRALRTNLPRARDLWALVYPFQRGPSSPGRRIVVEGGLDWVLPEVHAPSVNEELAGQILRNLVADCRSDSELVQVVMAARLRSGSRLRELVEEGLGSSMELDRARARFIAGWMPDDDALRLKLLAADPSRWVERIGERAIRRLDHEVWAREWLGSFLAEQHRIQRWAAGRLFLECSDAATPFWARDMVWESRASAVRRGEALLLLKKLKKKTDDSELRDKFLGYAVRELADVVPPWRRNFGWDDIRVTNSPDET